VRQIVAALEWLEQLTQVMATVQQKLAAALRQLVAALEWLEQLTQVMATVQQKLAAALRQPTAVERLEQLT